MSLSTDKVNSLLTYQSGFHNDDLVKKMIYNPFGKTGLKVSKLGFGGAQLALCTNSHDEVEGVETVIKAIQSGINYIDTAPYYGQGKAEIILGKALKKIPRNTYYIATKVGRYGATVDDMFDFSASRTLQSIDESLSRLGIEYIDILQVHDIEFASSLDIIINETLPVLEKMKNLGKTKFIGVTGYPISKLKELVERSTVKIDLVLSYCRSTLFNQTLQEYIPYFFDKNIAIISAAPLGMGLLTNARPPEWHPATAEIKEACEKAAQHCQERNMNISKLAVAYAFDQPHINTHLIGMQNLKVLEENLGVLWNGLSSNENNVKDEIITKFFKSLDVTHWEDREINIYWKKKRSSENLS